TRGPRVDALTAALDDRDRGAEIEKRRRARARIARRGRHLHLVDVPDDDRRPLYGLARPASRIVAAPPEVVPVIEVVDREVPTPASVPPICSGYRSTPTRPIVMTSGLGIPPRERGAFRDPAGRTRRGFGVEHHVLF